MKEKMESLGFKGVGGYFIPANASEGHMGYMRAPAADLATRPIQNLISVIFRVIFSYLNSSRVN
jgi:hypothetical protein